MRRLLLLTYAFPPDNTVGAVKPGRLFEYLPEFGWQPEIIAAKSDDGSVEGQPLFVHRVPSGEEGLAVRSTSRLAQAFMRFCVPYEDRLAWVPYAAAAGARLVRAGGIDAVYSTSPSLSSQIAGLALRARFGLPWIADFRDPISDNPFRTRQWWYPYDPILERLLFRYADRVGANTDTVATAWRARYPQWAHKICILWNSFDPRENIQPVAAPARCQRVLVHTGNLYGGRHPAALFAAMERLAADSSRIRLKLVGAISAQIFSRLGPLFGRLREKGVLEYDNRLVSRREALQEAAQADYLLLLDVNEKNASFQVPSKLFDYVRIGRPILAYTPTDSPVERILARSGISYVAIAPCESPDAGERKLEQFFRLPSDRQRPSPWFEETFNARTQAQTVAELLDGLLMRKLEVRGDDARTKAGGRCTH
jgi:glycosyltransferase involved in cell wall biosynthesis